MTQAFVENVAVSGTLDRVYCSNTYDENNVTEKETIPTNLDSDQQSRRRTTVSSFQTREVQERRVRGRRRRAARAESRTHARSLECALGRFQTRPGSARGP